MREVEIRNKKLLHVRQVMSSSEATAGTWVVSHVSSKRRVLLHDLVFFFERLSLVEFVLVDLLNRWSFRIHGAVAVSVHDFDRVAHSVDVLLLESSRGNGEEEEDFEEVHFWFLVLVCWEDLMRKESKGVRYIRRVIKLRACLPRFGGVSLDTWGR